MYYLVWVPWRGGRGKRRNDQRWWWNGKQRLSTLSLPPTHPPCRPVAVQNSGFAMDELFFNRPTIDYLSAVRCRRNLHTARAQHHFQGRMKRMRKIGTLGWLNGWIDVTESVCAMYILLLSNFKCRWIEGGGEGRRENERWIRFWNKGHYCMFHVSWCFNCIDRIISVN